MTSIAKPKILHEGIERNALKLTLRDYEGALSTLCAGCGHDSVTAAIVRGFFRARHPAPSRGQGERHRLLVQDHGLFPRQVPRQQHRAWAHAVGHDGRLVRQSRTSITSA